MKHWQLAFWNRCSYIISASILLVCCTQASSQVGPSLWGAKALSLPELHKRAKFRILIPRIDEKYQFQKAELVWIKKNTDMFPGYPERQAACLFYTARGTGGTVAIVEAKSFGSSKGDSLYQTVAEGYFFSSLKLGSGIQYGSAKSTDFMIVSYFPEISNRERDTLAQALAKAVKNGTKFGRTAKS